jgi:hypothetical protein
VFGIQGGGAAPYSPSLNPKPNPQLTKSIRLSPYAGFWWRVPSVSEVLANLNRDQGHLALGVAEGATCTASLLA